MAARLNATRFSALLAIAVCLSACVTTPVPLGTRPVTPNKAEVTSPEASISDAIGNSNVVLIRRYAQPTAFPVSVTIDKKKVATLSQRKFTAFNLPEGEYEGKTKWPLISAQKSLKFPVIIAGEDTHFFEILGEYDVNEQYVGTVTDVVAIRKIPSEEGVTYLSKCCEFVQPK